jgi:hypothetical protein
VSAVEAIRALIEAIILEPDGDELKITLKGDLAGMLRSQTAYARESKSVACFGEFRRSPWRRRRQLGRPAA